MLNWWNSMTILEQVFACIAIAATVVLIIQSVLLLIGVGMGGDADLDGGADADGADAGLDGNADVQDGGLSLFTVRGLVAFFTVGGWVGLALLQYLPPAAAIVLAFLAGTAALLGVGLLFKYALRLQSQGNLDIQNALGKTGKVYIPIPAQEGGQGKITILVQERLTELDAVTKAARTLSTGEMVTVAAVVDPQTVLVEPVQPNETKKQNQGGISQWIQS